MSQPELKKVIPSHGSTTVLEIQQPRPSAPDDSALTDQSRETTKENNHGAIEPSTVFADALEDAEHLLKYAAEAGVQIDTKIRSAVLDARTMHGGEWNEAVVANLLDALTKL